MTFVVCYEGASCKGNRCIQRNNESEEGRNYGGGYQLAIVSARARLYNYHITLSSTSPPLYLDFATNPQYRANFRPKNRNMGLIFAQKTVIIYNIYKECQDLPI